MSPFEVQLRRDLRLGWAGRGDMAVMLGFFLIILTLVPLAVGPDAAFLQPIAVPMIWIAAMLSSLAGFTRIFSEDVRCGWVDQVALSPLPLPLYVIAKAATHWVIGAVPMLLATPLMALMLYMDTSHLPALLLAQQARLAEDFEREGISFEGISVDEVETAAVRYYTPMLCQERSPNIRTLFQR
jgi:heme exporter protein B